MRGVEILNMKPIVLTMSGLVIAISVFFMIGMVEAINKTRGYAEWDLLAYTYAGVALLALAATVIWRALVMRTPVWEVAVQYAVSGGLLAWAMLWHALESQAQIIAYIHLAVAGVLCLWNLYTVYRSKHGYQ